MSSDMQSLFVIKRQAVLDNGATPNALVPAAGGSGCLNRIRGWFPFARHPSPPRGNEIKTRMDGPVTVLLPPPPQVYGIGTLFQSDPNHDMEAVRTSQQSLGAYRRSYDEQPNWPYPRRDHLARYSGLPSFLNGYLDTAISIPVRDGSIGEELTQRWFTQKPLVSKALFGAEWDQVKPQLRYVESALLSWPSESPASTTPRQGQLILAHSRLQQTIDGTPVFGGQVTIHFRHQDPRISCTNSYFPLLRSITLQRPDDSQMLRQMAMRQATQAVAGELTGPEAIGLYTELLAPLLTAGDETGADKWTDWHKQVAFVLVQALGQMDQERFKPLVALSKNASSLEITRALQAYTKQLATQQWQIRIVPYEGSNLFIYPFAARYYFAYLVELISPDGGAPWRVFVDAKDGWVLGSPTNRTLHANYYPTSGAALNNTLDNLSPQQVQDLKNEVGLYTKLMRLDGTTTLDLEDTTLNPQLLLEATNIAYHARALFQCFEDPADLGITWQDQSSNPVTAGEKIALGAPIKVIVGSGGSTYSVYFSHGIDSVTGLSIGQINFQTMMPGDPNGLTTNDNRPGHNAHGPVFAPALEREIIQHECGHAFMWKLKFDPSFGMDEAQRPFIFPLLEGYATFLARSLAVRDDFDPRDQDLRLWARSAWRQVNWDSMWDAGRALNVAGADLLPWPNIYPQADATGMQAFEVSMVWVRALWDIAWLLADPPVPPNGYDNVGQNERISAFKFANRLALASYFYSHGLTANYELAAEGIVDSSVSVLDTNSKVRLEDALAQRGIYAERGVQALAESPANSGLGSRLFVGSDQGVGLWDGQQPNSPVPWNLPDGSDVAALQADMYLLYAASESGVWSRGLNSGTAWQQVGPAFPADQLALSMAVLGGEVLVGTSQGLWYLNNNAWTSSKTDRMVISMTANDPGGGADPFLLVSTQSERIFVVTKTGLANWIIKSGVLDNTGARSTSAVFFQGDLYVGSTEGVRRRAQFQPSTASGGLWTLEDVDTQGNPLGAILCLVVDLVSNRVGAGTTHGLFWRESGGWCSEPNIPADAIVSCLFAGQRLAVGTLNRGLYVRENGTWIPSNLI